MDSCLRRNDNNGAIDYSNKTKFTKKYLFQTMIMFYKDYLVLNGCHS